MLQYKDKLIPRGQTNLFARTYSGTFAYAWQFYFAVTRVASHSYFLCGVDNQFVDDDDDDDDDDNNS